MKNIDLKNVFIMIVILVITVGIDQWTKVIAVNHLMGKEPLLFLNGLFQIVYAENPGAFLGMGGDWPRSLRFVIFGLLVVIGLVGIMWAIVKNKFNAYEKIAYSFILGGGIGNVIDRLTHDNGHVVDFLFIDLGFARTGVFNVADMAIVLGVIIAFWPSLISGLQKKEKAS